MYTYETINQPSNQQTNNGWARDGGTHAIAPCITTLDNQLKKCGVTEHAFAFCDIIEPHIGSDHSKQVTHTFKFQDDSHMGQQKRKSF